MAMGPPAANAVGWLPHEAGLRDLRADRHGLVLTKLDREKFAIRCGGEAVKINQKKSSSFADVQAFSAALATNSSIYQKEGVAVFAHHLKRLRSAGKTVEVRSAKDVQDFTHVIAKQACEEILEAV